MASESSVLSPGEGQADSHEAPKRLSEIRIILLGERGSGRSSAGDTILGREEFDTWRVTEECVKRQSEVAMRQITVVDTPDWCSSLRISWYQQKPSLQDILKWVKEVIESSVSLCPPGPHALLLVINLDSDTDWRSEEHLELLSERFWRHTIVLFTWGDELTDTDIEQHIERRGKDLQCLVEKCGNRYHVLNNKTRGDCTQVTELLEKIEDMVAGKSDCYYEIEEMNLQEMEEKLWKLRIKKREKIEELLQKTLGPQLLPKREGQADSHEAPQRLSEIRIVLLGERGSGRSSAGDTILGREEFQTKRGTEECVKRQGEVAGRQVTVVNTPEWYFSLQQFEDEYEDAYESPLQLTLRWIKEQIEPSVYLCPPGPHALLLVINLDSNTDWRSVEKHLELLSERVWRHTIVLFTWGDTLRHTTIEQHIERGGEELQWLVEKCWNRYHVLNNKNRGDRTQVTELLEKIEDMVAGKSDCYCEIEEKDLQEMEEKFRTLGIKERQRIEELLQKTLGPQLLPKREGQADFYEAPQRLSEIRIVLLGKRWTRGSSAGNTILGREEFDTKIGTEEYVKRQGEVAGRQITVVDTPGWDVWLTRNDLWELKQECVKFVEIVTLCHPGPHTFLLVINLDSFRTWRSVKEDLELLCERVWRHTIVLFTWGDTLRNTTIEQHIERGGKELQCLVEKCGNRYHVLNNKNRDDRTQVTELLEKIEDMLAGKSDCYYEIEEKDLREMEEKFRTLGIKQRQRIKELLQKTLGPQLLPKSEFMFSL
ncbi:GTPase IMAP family member 8-like [Lepisosteus oculatus]|uniref:GTPase IMAP family member 8-like n=1 Tax=Lepisosteus oculatus TaxID=7918 RepID=UPI0035F52954